MLWNEVKYLEKKKSYEICTNRHGVGVTSSPPFKIQRQEKRKQKVKKRKPSELSL